MEFPERLNELLKTKGIKQKDIVEKLGVTKGYVSRVCNGNKHPSADFINAVSELTGKSTHWILFGKEENDDLDALNKYINYLIEIGRIDEKGNMSKKIKEKIWELVESEIYDKLQKKKEQH